MDGARVTIVVSTKDQFARAPAMLRRLRETVPGTPLIYVLSGPMGTSTAAALREEAARNPDLEILDAGLDFANPFLLRNLAIPRIRTPLAMFLFNDVFPRTDDWLAELLRAADAHPDAAIFQPLIWEGDEEPHATWSSLGFVDDGAGLHLVHRYDAHRKPPGRESAPQPFFLEDHAVLARTEFLAAQCLFDPGVAYTKEYLDMALTARFGGAEIRAVPSAEVRFWVPDGLSPEDLLYFAFRRSEEPSAGSVARLCRKWGIEAYYDGIARRFFHQYMADVAWSGPKVPDDPRLQRRMALAFFVAVGFNRFDGVDLPSFFPRFEAGAGGALDVELTRSMIVPEWPSFAPDDAERRASLRRGDLFPVQRSPERLDGLPGRGLFYRPFLLAEASGIRGSERGVLDLLGPHASMIVREAGDAAEGRYRAWLHAPYLPSERGAADAIVGSARSPWPGVELRWHRSEEALPVSTRVGFGAAAEGWRLVHWIWNRHPLESLRRSLAGV